MTNPDFSPLYGKYPVGDPAADYGKPPPMGGTFLAGMMGIPPPPVQEPPMRDFRNRSLTQPFRLRERIKTGKPLFMVGALLGEPETAKIMAQAGADCIFLDWEHTPMGIREVVNLIKLIQTAGEGNCAVVVRVPNFAHHHIAWLLDAGASGIIIPHTETVEQVKEVFDAARFPTHGGKRSFPPAAMTWGYNDGVPDGQMVFDMYAQAAIILQIESDLGCKNVKELAALPGVDCLMVGNGDLRMDMGLHAAMDGPEKAYNDNLRLVSEAARDNNLGLWCFSTGPESAAKRAAQGYTGFMTCAENFVLAMAVRMTLNSQVEAVRKWEKEGAKVEYHGTNWGETAEDGEQQTNGSANGQ